MHGTSNRSSDDLSHRPGRHRRLRLRAVSKAADLAAATGARDVVAAAEQGDAVDVLIVHTTLGGR
ncbi:hypothetical protein ABZ297_32650 [Nonomuraea sp. NPDC005983]|uniref:hypothetical protein n=1 Tax=Nonomuraea sp. NPDC005983 TaxID=3155595 RepID=UPI0033BF04AC